MSTYSVYSIKIDNSLSFTPGPTAGYVLAIAADGSTYWSLGGFGATGPAGANGATGANGTNGATGPTGPAGSSVTQTFVNLTDGTTISWTYSVSAQTKVTLGGNRTLSIIGATSGDQGLIIITQDGTGGRRIDNWPSTSKFPSGTYSFATQSSSTDLYSFVYDGVNFYWNWNRNFI